MFLLCTDMNMSELMNEYVNIHGKQLGTGINVVSTLHLFGTMFAHGELYDGTRDN